MTRAKILAMEPGREMDALVAEKVMGWKERIDLDWFEGYIARYVPGTNDVKRFEPSTDISAAWEVVEKMETFEHKHLTWHERERQWVFGFGKGTWGRWSAWSPKPAEAICKAALLAVMDL